MSAHDEAQPGDTIAFVESLDQLEFWPLRPSRSPSAGAITAAVARTLISPGWWPRVSPWFTVPDIIVRRCCECEGALDFEIDYSEGDADREWLEREVERLRDTCATTCGCCGSSLGKPYRPRVDGVTRVVCMDCRRHLENGESYASVADRYWRWDGSRRTRSLGVQSPRPPAAATADRRGDREPGALPAEELRRTIADIRETMRADYLGNDELVDRISLIAGLHVGGGLERGQRVLIIGPSGAGKTFLIQSVRKALEAAGWPLIWALSDFIDFSSPGWRGMSVGDLIAEALGKESPDSVWARHMVLVIDELHHGGLTEDITDSSHRTKRQEVLSSLLGIVGGGTVHLGDGAQEWASNQALVIGMGAFTGLLDPTKAPSPRDLVRAGIPIELCSRFEEVLTVRPLPEARLREMLRQWPALTSLAKVCERLGYTVRIHDEVFSRAARAVFRNDDDATPRTAGGWIVAVLRAALMAALRNANTTELEITPDSLSIARSHIARRGRDEPPGNEGGWDATIILTPR